MNLLATFGKLTPEERDMLVALGSTQAFKSGETIVHQGEIVSSLMIISTGFVRVTRAYLDELVAEFAGPLGPGEIIGEMSLMDGIGASAKHHCRRTDRGSDDRQSRSDGETGSG